VYACSSICLPHTRSESVGRFRKINASDVIAPVGWFPAVVNVREPPFHYVIRKETVFRSEPTKEEEEDERKKKNPLPDLTNE
jgi:hypothetical protein